MRSPRVSAEILDRDRQAVQRPRRLAGRELAVGRRRIGEQLLDRAQRHDRVDRGLTRSICARNARMTSTAESSRDATRAASCRAGANAISGVVTVALEHGVSAASDRLPQPGLRRDRAADRRQRRLQRGERRVLVDAARARLLAARLHVTDASAFASVPGDIACSSNSTTDDRDAEAPAHGIDRAPR